MSQQQLPGHLGPCWDPKIIPTISSHSPVPSAKQVLESSQHQSGRVAKKRDRQRALSLSLCLSLSLSLSLTQSDWVKMNKKSCVWKYLPFSCLLSSCDISHVGHQSCSELMTHPAHESFSPFPQTQQGMLGLFLLSSCWSKAVPKPGRICQHRHFDLSLWNR